MKYRAEIDGLRSVAVIPVILFHGGFAAVSGGFVGVDVFFVISGYLITTILLSDIDAGRYSLLQFYERRARRILPALFLVMLACIPFAWAFMMQTQLRDFFESLTTTALFASNFLFWSESGYFAAVAEEKPLLHMWSLAVEEQYYLLFPPLLWLAMKLGRSAAGALISLGLIISLALALFAPMEPEGRFFLTHTRVWEILAGSAVAWISAYHPPRGNRWLADLGLVMVVATIFLADHHSPFPGYAIPAVLGTALLIQFATPDAFSVRLLSLRPFVAIGLISFSAYLWHQPLFAFARIATIGPPPGWVMAALATLSLLLAWATWAWVEQPFRGRPARALPGRSALFAAALAGMAAFSALGWYGHEKEGFPDRAVVRNLTQPLIDARYERFRTWDVLDGIVPARFDLMRFSDDPATTKLLLLGDSHSKGLFNALYQNPDLFPGLEVRRLAINFDCYSEADTQAQSAACVEELRATAPALFDKATHAMMAARWHRPGRLPALEVLPDALRAMRIQPLLVSNTAEYDTEGPVLIADIARDVGFDGSAPFPVQAANAAFWAERSALPRETNAALRALALQQAMPYRDRWALICDEAAQTCTGVTPEAHAVTYDYGHWTLAGSAHFGREMAARDWLNLPPNLR